MNKLKEAMLTLAAILGLIWILATDLNEFSEWLEQRAGSWL